MMLRLRQICLVALSLEPAVSRLCGALGLKVFYRDPAVGKYGLENAVMPVGNTFLEVVAPTREGTAAGRYLERRHGEGGYMVILDCDDIQPWVSHVADVGVRVAADLDYPGEYRGLQLHPRDTGGALLEINWSHGGASDGAYHPAGPDWHGVQDNADEPAIVAAEIQCQEPEALAARWGEILRRPIGVKAGVPVIDLDMGQIRFVAVKDGRGEGLGGIDVRMADNTGVPAAADKGKTNGNALMLCGVRVRVI